MSPAGPLPPREVVIGLDVGTTAVKAAAFGVDSHWLRTAEVPVATLRPAPGQQVQDPRVVRAAVRRALAEVAAGLGGAEVLAVSVGTAMHALVGLDGSGEPVTDLLTWADARSLPQSQRLVDSGAAPALHRTSGTPIHPMTPLTKLMWFAENAAGLAAEVSTWAGLKDLVLADLTGHVVTEASTASGTGLWCLDTKGWNPEAVALAGIDVSQLPPILDTTDQLPLRSEAAHATGLPAGTPVVVGAGDGPLGNLGTGALAPGVVGISIGTSGAARVCVPRPEVDGAGRTFCYYLAEDAWVLGGAVSNGGIVGRWAADLYLPTLDMAAALDLASDIPAGSDGMVLLPYLLAERAPLWDATLPAAFLGMRLEHGPAHYLRAAIEGVGLQVASLVAQLERLTEVTEVRATGGVFRSPLWREVLAGALGRPLVVTDGEHGTALGAAALGLVALGRERELALAVRRLRPVHQAGGAGGHRPPGAEAADIVEPTPDSVRAYRDLRERLPVMLRQYEAVAALFDPA